ncbi:uncharacterized protein N7479_001544 [Penicillium vulpinum]|nr:uncharacterized protein N7479_001544 [Penicillium vulpinum]KAJ5971626.1 hypothetical protein N7479_001544 [Penicillium vulpinum]
MRWGREEDEILRACVEEYTQIGHSTDWSRVAAKLPLRTNKDCRKRWINRVCGSLRKGPWETDEDMTLREAVAQHGRKWTLVAGEVGSRSADQCAKRWQHNLDPRLDHQRWTPKEDELLLESVERYGREWRKIQEKHYSTRSANDLKNRILSKKVTSRPPSRSELGCLSSPPSVGTGDLGQDSTGSDTNSANTSGLDPVVFHAEGWGGIYNSNDLLSDVDQAMGSTINVQQPQNQQMQPQKQAVPLQPLSHFDPLMIDDNTDHLPVTSSLFWPVGLTSPQRACSGLSTHGSFSNTILTSGPDAMSYDLYNPTQTDARDGNGLDGSGRTSSHVADLQLGFDTVDPVPDGMKNDNLSSLLAHKAGRLINCSPGGSVSIQAEGCDREVLNYVLDVLLPIRHLVKMEINM